MAAKATILDDETLAKVKAAADALKERWPKARILSPSSVATGSAVESIYLLYSQLSADAAHPTMSALARYLVQGSDYEGLHFRGIDLVPRARPGEVATTVHYACIALTGACVAFNDLVGPTAGGCQFISVTEEFDALKASTGIG